MGGKRARRPARWLLAVAPLVLVACSDGDGPTVEESEATTTTLGEVLVPVTGTDGETRPVPTVPPSTIAGEVGSEPGVVDASPTIAPAPVDPSAPTTSVLPPTTELVGDPQPQPGTTSPPPPPPTTVPGDPDACERLDSFDIVGVIEAANGLATTGESVAAEVCRYSSGSFVAEVHFLSVAEVRDEWYSRAGIEPVGEVSGEAVGFSSFIPPGSPEAAGYTIALEGGSRGVVVGVAGSDDARAVAGQIAIFARESA